MTTELAAYCGKLVRLTVIDLDADPAQVARWNQNSEYQHLLDWGPISLSPLKQIQVMKWINAYYKGRSLLVTKVEAQINSCMLER